eukprot:TRINITY_DN8249_c0_g1_i1.p1 TRINITY_DN8249_c0_g1~~TRINITY_DN8249_c0_g1_i1.p1  ORF type:complete len:1119 (-),score=64.97 TRINITY_DN8249_c0_g1_i1:396-3752(-)
MMYYNIQFVFVVCLSISVCYSDISHDDVPTNVTPNSDDVARDWAHDFEILKLVVESRGFSTVNCTYLCQLPCVYCNYGYRRRVPAHAKRLMGDWVGKEYQVILKMAHLADRASFPSTLFNLRRVGYLQVHVNAGEMPSGVHVLNNLKALWIEGNGTHGLEGELPARFWFVKTRMLLLASMGPQFAGHLEADLPVCDHLDYSLSLYRLPRLTGDISALKRCSKLEGAIDIFSNPLLGGNVWETMLSWEGLQESINMWGSNFSGKVPFALTSNLDAHDPWVKWCEAHRGARLSFTVVQQVGSQLPAGLQRCSNIFTKFDVHSSDIHGSFPLNFSNNSNLGATAFRIWDNKFHGAIPDIPRQTTIIDLHANRWNTTTPFSWSLASNLRQIDLSDCGTVGPLPAFIGTAAIIKLSGNRYFGPAPTEWGEASIEHLDLSNNSIRGPPFRWGWPGIDPNTNYDPEKFLEAYIPSPRWPLKVLRVSNNPLGISVGFLLGMMTQYELSELHADNCSLHGFINSEDLFAQEPASGGGVTTRADARALTSLTTLSLAFNSIHNFGYNDRAASFTSCWPTESWEMRLPRLSSLNLHGCAPLKVVHPLAFNLANLNVQGISSVVPPPLVQDARECDAVLGSPADTCNDAKWQVCLYNDGVFRKSQLVDGLECAGVGMTFSFGFGQVRMDDDLFDLSLLCRCVEFGTLQGDVCIGLAEDEPEHAENDSRSVVVLVGISSAVFVALFSIICCIWCRVRRRRTAQPEEKLDAKPGFDQELSVLMCMLADGGNANTETSQLFADMEVLDIAERGVYEHWMILPNQISIIQSDVARGGFGSVNRGLLFGTTEVAMKVPAGETCPAHTLSLFNEIRLLRRLRHTNIVLFYGVTATKVESGTSLSVILEWVHGGDFRNYVLDRRQNGEFYADAEADDPDKIPEKTILVDVARGMQYLHGQDPPIMHRDLKPGNVLIEKLDPPRGKITDFGLSALIDSDISGKAGSKNYMAPEVSGARMYNATADVFSFGCVCYFVMMSRSPHVETVLQDCIKISQAPVLTEMHRLLLSVATACLKYEPSERINFYHAYVALNESRTDVVRSSDLPSEGGTSMTRYPSSRSSPSASFPYVSQFGRASL